ncbi:murein transglycosylase [Vibrio sp. Of7-15]|uniref:murein transglycosylase n=1 Tax=Vibrio sp. Of7-15 TaxID=2724879 RepID=UPI001EF3AE29|nr:murein transglycosylase [Vibrio sp. Of7-15]MCG7499851.1 murein transglycosylase [Vibrio sp. Of7-15]
MSQSKNYHWKVMSAGILLGSVAYTSQAASVSDNVKQQRIDYQSAQKALDSRDVKAFERIRPKIADYPLTPYVDYRAFLIDLNERTPKEVHSFSKKYSELPFSSNLPFHYLSSLGRGKQWQTFLEYRPEPPRTQSLQCYYYRAQLAQGNKQVAWGGANQLWLNGNSIDDACDPLFKEWTKAKLRTDEVILDRMVLSFEKRNLSLLKYLAKLPSGDSAKAQAKKIIALYQKPETVGTYSRKSKVTEVNQKVVELAFQKLARQDTKKAVKVYPQVIKGQHYKEDKQQSLAEYVAFRLMNTDSEELANWRDLVLVNSDRSVLVERRIRLALQHSDWADVKKWIAVLSKDKQDSLRWQYWLARVEQSEGKDDEAKERLASLLGQRNFYSVAAAHALSKPIEYPVKQAKKSSSDITGFAGALERIDELIRVDKLEAAKTEWGFLLKRSTQEQVVSLASYAAGKKWHHLTVTATIKGKLWDYVDLRFPLAHQWWFDFYSKQRQVDKVTLMALARQESAMYSQARSPVGARGLMQLMPTTAKYTAKKLGDKYKGDASLYDVGTNIRLGSSYLKSLLEQYDNNRIFAFAGYNAGPNRVKRWRKRSAGNLDAYAFIESIPFKETRGYVQNVLMFETYYRNLLNINGEFLTKHELALRY